MRFRPAGRPQVITLSQRAVVRLTRTRGAPRVGLCGLVGGGNLGNNGSLEAVVAYLKKRHPDAVLDFLGADPEQLTAAYGVPAARMRWYQPDAGESGRMNGLLMRGIGASAGLLIDAVRIANWVRRHDVVIVPGMGVLEATLPLRVWHTPYWMFVVCAAGRIFGTKVALVSVGASAIKNQPMRWLFASAAKLAYYRSYRDTAAQEAMVAMGVNARTDPVYPDVAFALPAPPDGNGASRAVGIGVMDYWGDNDDRTAADSIHAAYVEKLKQFVRWLVADGRPVRIMIGDGADETVAKAILTDLQTCRPGLDPALVVFEPAASLDDLMRQIAAVDVVVAMRFHNVVCALRMAKPTLAIGYADKHAALMADMGVPEFCLHVKELDVTRLTGLFRELETRAAEVREILAAHNLVQEQLLDDQFARLSEVLLGTGRSSR
jgi:polysaccharide pyruvyl transferase WcaK-like protein